MFTRFKLFFYIIIIISFVEFEFYCKKNCISDCIIGLELSIKKNFNKVKILKIVRFIIEMNDLHFTQYAFLVFRLQVKLDLKVNYSNCRMRQYKLQ